jgi:acyl-homoserine lactone acylase PvdQ
MANQVQEQHPAYTGDDMPANRLQEYRRSVGTEHSAEASNVAKVIYTTVKAGNAPMRLPLGADAWGLAKSKVESMKKDLEAWKYVSEGTTTQEKEDVQGKLEFFQNTL